VKLDYVHWVQTNVLNRPESEADFTRTLNRSLVRLNRTDKIEEYDRSVFLTPGQEYNSQFTGVHTLREHSETDLNREAKLKALMAFAEATGDSISHLLADEEELEEFLSDTALTWKQFGVPQGAATSCTNAITCILHLTNPNLLRSEVGPSVRVVMYADDGLIFLKREEDLPQVLALFDRTGVSLNAEKSK
jgi:hypothetical protein